MPINDLLLVALLPVVWAQTDEALETEAEYEKWQTGLLITSFFVFCFGCCGLYWRTSDMYKIRYVDTWPTRFRTTSRCLKHCIHPKSFTSYFCFLSIWGEVPGAEGEGGWWGEGKGAHMFQYDTRCMVHTGR